MLSSMPAETRYREADDCSVKSESAREVGGQSGQGGIGLLGICRDAMRYALAMSKSSINIEIQPRRRLHSLYAFHHFHLSRVVTDCRMR